MSKVIKDISLEVLADKEDLSVRTINICKDLELFSLNAILEFYKTGSTFKNIRNCGHKSEKELITLCEKYLTSVILDSTKEIDTGIEENYDKSVNDLIDELTPFQKAVLNRQIEYLSSNLSNRALNGLHTISNTLNSKIILDVIFKEQFDFKKIQNIGRKTLIDLNNFKLETLKFIGFLQNIKKEDLGKEYARLIILHKFSILSENFEENFELAFDVNKKLKLFYLIKLLSNSKELFNRFEELAFRLLYSNNQIDTLGISGYIGITRERLRQIKAKLEENIQNYFIFISNFSFDDIVNYGIDDSRNYYIINKIIINKINQSENIDFNQKFYSIIFSLLLRSKYKILGDDEVLTGIKRTIRIKKYINQYLIKSEIFNSFNFQDFTEDLYKKLSDRVDETYTLQFEGYIYQFFLVNSQNYFNEIKTICESIILHEFDLLINSDGYIEIERNTFKQLHEYCYDILQEINKPMSIDEIEGELNIRYPDLKKTNSSIRGSLIREDELFVCFGRTSTYALRKWENEKENMKGGSIRDIIEEYLNQFDKPKHISEVLDFILKYRADTNEKSILTSLKVDNSKRFNVYSGNYVGLNSKNYPKEVLNFKKVNGSHFKPHIFITMNGWDVEKVVNYMIEKNGYSDQQIRYFIQKKISEGIFKITPDNKLIV